MNPRTLTCSALLSLFASTCPASFSYTGTKVTENFNGMTTTTFSNANGVSTSVNGTGFDATRLSGTGTNASPNMPFIVDTGSDNTGGIHSYGATGAADRALGTLASGSNTPGFGVMITNNSTSVLSSVTLAFNTEEYRNSTSVQNTIVFAYGLSGGTATAANYLADSSLKTDSRFDLVGDAPVASNGVLATPISTPVSGTINVTVGIGQSIFFRWSDTNDAGNDAGLAIDDFVFTATPAGSPSAVPEPASATLLGLGLVATGLIARRRVRSLTAEFGF